MFRIKTFIFVFSVLMASNAYAWRSADKMLCTVLEPMDLPKEAISFQESELGIVSSGTILTEVSFSQFGIPVATATYEESLHEDKPFKGRVDYKQYKYVKFYDERGHLLNQISRNDIIKFRKKWMSDALYFSASVSSAGYTAITADIYSDDSIADVGLYDGEGNKLFYFREHTYPANPEPNRYYAKWGRGLDISGNGNFVAIQRGYTDKDSLDPDIEGNAGYRRWSSLAILNRKGEFIREIHHSKLWNLDCPTLSNSGNYGFVMATFGPVLFDLKNKYYVALQYPFVAVKGSLFGVQMLNDSGNFNIWIRSKDYKKYLIVPYSLSGN